jgi:hypothetical protein
VSLRSPICLSSHRINGLMISVKVAAVLVKRYK